MRFTAIASSILTERIMASKYMRKCNKSAPKIISCQVDVKFSMRRDVAKAKAETKMFRRSKRYLFLLLILFAAGCFFFINSASIINELIYGSKKQLQKKSFKFNTDGLNTIETEGCIIPALDPFDATIKKIVEDIEDLPQCHNATLALLAKNRTTIWIRFDDYILDFYNITNNDEVTCCYRSFYRPDSIVKISSKNVDNRVEYRQCKTFNNAINVNHEFVRVNCSVNTRQIYEQFYLFAPIKEFTKHGDKYEIVNNSGYNVLIMGIDTVSRLNLLRTMPKTVKYLKDKGATEMFGYNKVGLNTFPNLVPMLIGETEEEIKKSCYPHRRATFDNCPFVWEWFRQAGYYTAYVEDGTKYATFNYLKPGFVIAPTDYYTRTFLREAERYVDTSSKLCMNDIYYYKVILDYIEDITWRLKSRRLFGFFWETSMTHDYLTYPMRMDDDYVKMFKTLENSGYLNDTIVLFVSDHGIRWGDIRHTKQGRLEECLPFLYVLTPKSFQNEYKNANNNLQLNSERLTTPFDVHETLLDLISIKNIEDSAVLDRSSQNYASKRGISLFLNIPTNRTCETAGIGDQWCTCRKEVRLDNNDEKVIEAAITLVKMINLGLKAYPECAVLQLFDIKYAMEIEVGKPEKNEVSWKEYLVSIQTDPGGAMFEGVLRRDSKDQSWQLKGAPTRTNQYNNQSRCIDDYLIRNYCYCN